MISAPSSAPARTLNLMGMTLADLETFVTGLGERSFRARQLFQWIYGKQARSFGEMTDLSASFRRLLEGTATIGSLELAARRQSERDGTLKFLFRLGDGFQIETVLIPPEPASPGAERRLTVCISTQVGCPLDCAFCATGTMGFRRNLTAGEIVEQVLLAQHHAHRRISNVVFMGMGEPMLNYDNVMTAVELLTDERSLAIGARHMTISTAGYADRIRQMADEGRTVKLALSLHSLDNDKRALLMPVTKKHPVPDLVEALEYYYRTLHRRPTLEYILFNGFNDTDGDIDALVRLSRRVPCKVNLIPFHSIAFASPAGFARTLTPTPRQRIEEFAQALRDRNVTVMIRSSAGEDIEAACGQLVVQEQRRQQPNAAAPQPSPLAAP